MDERVSEGFVGEDLVSIKDAQKKCSDSVDPISGADLKKGKVLFVKRNDHLYNCIQFNGDDPDSEQYSKNVLKSFIDRKMDHYNVPFSEHDLARLRKLANISEPPPEAFAAVDENGRTITSLQETQFLDSVRIRISWECTDDVQEFVGMAQQPGTENTFNMKAHYVIPAETYAYFQIQDQLPLANR